MQTTNTPPAVADKALNGHHQQQHTTSQRKGGFFSSSPGFGGWIKLYAVDLGTMLAMGMIGLGVYFADPAPTRSFAVDFSDGESECAKGDETRRRRHGLQ